jgi:hypothetical protein
LSGETHLTGVDSLDSATTECVYVTPGLVVEYSFVRRNKMLREVDEKDVTCKFYINII